MKSFGSKKIKFHAWVKKCHFGNFSEMAKWHFWIRPNWKYPTFTKGQKGIIRQRQHHWMCDDDAWTEKSDCNFVRCIIIGWKEECEKLEPQLIHTAQRASECTLGLKKSLANALSFECDKFSKISVLIQNNSATDTTIFFYPGHHHHPKTMDENREK